MTICRFFAEGKCKFGNNCRFEHPRDHGSLQYQNNNRFGALAGGGFAKGGGGRTDSYRPGDSRDPPLKFGLNREHLELDFTSERPIWPMSCYGPGKDAPRQLIEGPEYEISPEEVRVLFYLARASGDPVQLEQYNRNEQAVSAKAQTAGQEIVSNPDRFIQSVLNAENQHPNRLDQIVNPSGPWQRPQGMANSAPNTASSFGVRSIPFAASSQQTSTPALGTFGSKSPTPGFGAPSALGGGGSAFGAPSALGGGASAFGKPSMPGHTAPAFGQASQRPAFGSASTSGGSAPTFGAPTQPGPSPFGQASEPTQSGSSPFGQASAPTPSGTSPFGQTPASVPSGTSPFGQASAPAQSRSSPFGRASALGSQPTPFSTSQTLPVTGSGFGALSNPQNQQTPAFGQPSQPAQPSPFAQNNEHPQQTRPFAQDHANTQHASPFGQNSTTNQQQANPFGQNNNNAQPTATPFGQSHPQFQQQANTCGRNGTDQPAQPTAFGQPRTDPSKDTAAQYSNGTLTWWEGRRVTYTETKAKGGSRVPTIENSAGQLQQIWHPTGPPNPLPDKAQGLPESYMGELGAALQEAYEYVAQNGRFKDGIMPEIPPKNEWVSWAI